MIWVAGHLSPSGFPSLITLRLEGRSFQLLARTTRPAGCTSCPVSKGRRIWPSNCRLTRVNYTWMQSHADLLVAGDWLDIFMFEIPKQRLIQIWTPHLVTCIYSLNFIMRCFIHKNHSWDHNHSFKLIMIIQKMLNYNYNFPASYSVKLDIDLLNYTVWATDPGVPDPPLLPHEVETF